MTKRIVAVPIDDVVKMIDDAINDGVCDIPKELINAELGSDKYRDDFWNLDYLSMDLYHNFITHDDYLSAVRDLVWEIYENIWDKLDQTKTPTETYLNHH